MPQTQLDKQLGALQRLHKALQTAERDLKEWQAYFIKDKADTIARKRREILNLQRILGNRVLADNAGIPWLDEK